MCLLEKISILLDSTIIVYYYYYLEQCAVIKGEHFHKTFVKKTLKILDINKIYYSTCLLDITTKYIII